MDQTTNQEPSIEQQSLRATAILVIAALTYPRLVCRTMGTITSSSTALSKTSTESIVALDPSAAPAAFDAAEAFVRESEKRGYDLASIVALANMVGE